MARSAWRTITARKPDECGNCGEAIEPGELIRWHPHNGTVHPGWPNGCQKQMAPEPLDGTTEAAAASTPARTSNGNSPRTMKSKFASKCKTCGGRIEAGDEIVWSKATGASHAAQEICDSYLTEAQERAMEQGAEARLLGLDPSDL